MIDAIAMQSERASPFTTPSCGYGKPRNASPSMSTRHDAAGWNAALDEFTRRLGAMPLNDDTRASFAVYVGAMMYVDEATQEKMQ